MNKIRSVDEIYSVLDEAMSNIPRPLSCAELMDRPDVRGAAIAKWGKDIQKATDKLSDTLGFMWRRQVLDRFSSPVVGSSRARFAYAKAGDFKDFDTPMKYIAPERTSAKGDMEIIEKNGEVIISLKDFTIVIRPK